MFYDFAILIPAGTTEAAPKEETLKLTYGIIHRVEVEFTPGCHRYAFVRIYKDEHQLLPTNPDQAFASDGHTIVIDEHEELFYPPYTLVVRGYSPEADYDHTIIVRVGILPPQIIAPMAGFGGMFTKLFKILGIGK